MRPLTDSTPKPLLAVGGKPLIVWHLEKLAAAKSDYYRAAYDHTRSELLMEVDRAWELSVPADAPVLGPDYEGDNQATSGVAYITEKLKRIIIPRANANVALMRAQVDAEVKAAARLLRQIRGIPE